MSVNPFLTSDERRILESARIGIAGAGGLGSNCAMHLVRAGVKNLVIADFDVVSESNLNRQFFFRDQIGCKKVEALAQNLRRIEPDLNLTLYPVRLDAENLPQLFGDCAILAEAFDNAETKSMLLSTMLPLKKTIVSASGIAGWGRSTEIMLRCVGKNLILIGDLSRDVNDTLAPESPRVGIAAAMEANTIVSLLLEQTL